MTSYPSKTSDTYTPDGLIAGMFPLVTDTVTITGSANLVRGTLVGKKTVGAGSAAAMVGTGNATVGAITIGAKAKVGAYILLMTAATTFVVRDPDGDLIISNGVLGTAVADVEIGFTATAGGTPAIAGDTITITVAAGSGSFVKALAAATDGSQDSRNWAVLADDAAAAGGDVTAPIYIAGEFNTNAMIFGAGITAASAKTSLMGRQLFLKSAVLGDVV